MKELTHKVAVVTGATRKRGLGRAIALALAGAGAAVVVTILLLLLPLAAGALESAGRGAQHFVPSY